MAFSIRYSPGRARAHSAAAESEGLEVCRYVIVLGSLTRHPAAPKARALKF